MKTPNYAKLWSDSFQNGAGTMRQYQAEASARAYDSSRKIWEDGFRRAAELPFTKEDTVLDIGCGPGVLAIPLAPRVRSVIMLDPSKAMLRLAEAHAGARELTNLTSVNETWEEADPARLGRVDYAIASYSLAMPDLGAAIAKMNAVARKGVYLYWFNGMTTWEKIAADLRPVIYGEAAPGRPKSDIIYGLLSQMGISADVKDLEGTAFDKEFPDRAAALMDLRGRLKLDTNRFDPILNDYLDKAGIYAPENGKWYYRDKTKYVCLSWKTAPGGKKEAC